jgi:serine/threonine protein phosphatase PrpC
MTINIFSGTDPGKARSEKPNEDNYNKGREEIETINGSLFVVCDGMGGHAGGQMASSIAVREIVAHMKEQKYPNPSKALTMALERANTYILGYAADNPQYKGMGTTACVLLLQGEKAWIAYAGDSRVYLYLGDKKELHRLTKDHSLVERVWLKDQLEQAKSHREIETIERKTERHPDKNQILKALGTSGTLKPEAILEAVMPKSGDVFLMCSDGLTDMVYDHDIEAILQNNNATLQQKGQGLIDKANADQVDENGKLILVPNRETGQLEPLSGGKDNITVQLVQIENSSNKKRVYKSYNPSYRPQAVEDVGGGKPPVLPPPNRTGGGLTEKRPPIERPTPPKKTGGKKPKPLMKLLGWIVTVIFAIVCTVAIVKYSTQQTKKKDLKKVEQVQEANEKIPKINIEISEINKKISEKEEEFSKAAMQNRRSLRGEINELENRKKELEKELKKYQQILNPTKK